MPFTGLLNMANGQPMRVEGGPPGFLRSTWDIVATFDARRTPTAEQRAALLMALLEDRFRLVLRREVRETSVYALTLARTDRGLGPSLTRADRPCDAPGRPRYSADLPVSGQRPACGILGSLPASAILGGSVPMENLAHTLGIRLQRPVVDRTGLTGEFDLVLRFAQDRASLPPPVVVPVPEPSGLPDLFTALREQLGLKLESTRAPLDYYVIERVQAPVN
jgi:uncharacterized protein (TIGR03435 family)